MLRRRLEKLQENIHRILDAMLREKILTTLRECRAKQSKAKQGKAKLQRIIIANAECI
jgi:hypothetical protein